MISGLFAAFKPLHPRDLLRPQEVVHLRRSGVHWLGLLDAVGNVVMLVLCAVGWRKAGG